MKVTAIDFETYYDDEVSLKAIPTWNYTHHPKAVPHTVSFFGDDGFSFVGPPETFDWRQLAGVDLIMHNAHFDGLVIKRLQREGIIPNDLKFGNIYDTADMVSYLRFPRALGDVIQVLYGITLNKPMRDKMKGKTRAQMDAEGWRADMDQYALEDAAYTYKLFKDHGDKWPKHERRLSYLNREACWKGFRVDVETAYKNLSLLKGMLGERERAIPWDWSDNKTAFVHTKVREQARLDKVPNMPSSFAKDSEEFAAWALLNGKDYPWITAIIDYNQIKWMVTKIETLLAGCDENQIYHYDLKYFGADTGRYSAGSERGDSGRFSVHGLPKEPKFGVNLRSLIIPREGCKFVVWDFSQIEPRLIHWATGNKALLRKIEVEKLSVYQAEAEVCGYGHWKDLKKEDPKLYSFVKAQYLGGQYQCSAKKFKVLAKKQAGMNLTDQESVDIVSRFRSNNPRIPAFWRMLQGLVVRAALERQDLVLGLPSGRDLTYYNVRHDPQEGGYLAEYRKGSTPYHLYGGSLTNNFIQGAGRDVLGEAILRLADTEFGAPLWTVHDEGINEVPSEIADAAKVREVVIDRPSWAKSLPIDSEVVVSNQYLK